MFGVVFIVVDLFNLKYCILFINEKCRIIVDMVVLILNKINYVVKLDFKNVYFIRN